MTEKERASHLKPSRSPALLLHDTPLGRPSSRTRQSAPDPLQPALAANLHRLRLEHGLSLSALAERAGLDERTLSRLEAGSETPTIRVLWGIANAFGVPFSTLVQAPSARAEQALDKPRGLARRAVVRGPAAGAASRTEVYELTLAPRARETIPAEDDHARESLLVTAGQLVVHHAGRVDALSVGDSVTISANVERLYENPTDAATVIYVKVLPAKGR